MGSSRDSLMNQALGILAEEGFKLPTDVVETLSSFGGAQRTRDNERLSPDADGRPGSSRTTMNISHTDRKVREWSGNDDIHIRTTTDRPSPESGDHMTPSRDGRRISSIDLSPDNDVFGTEDVASGAQSFGCGVSSESNSTASTVREAGRDKGRNAGEDMSRFTPSDTSGTFTPVYDSGAESIGNTYAGLITPEEAEARVENMMNLNKDLEQTLAGRSMSEVERDISYDSGFSDCTKVRNEGAQERVNNTVHAPATAIGEEESKTNNVVRPIAQERVNPTRSPVASDEHKEVRKSETKKTSAQSTTEVSSESKHETKMEVETSDEITSSTVMDRGGSLISRQDSSSQHSQKSETMTSSGTAKDDTSPKRTRVVKKEISQDQKSVSNKIGTADGVVSEETKSTSSGSELNMTQDMKTSVDETGKLQTEEKRTTDTKQLLSKENTVAKTEDRVDPVTGQKHLVTETSTDRDDTASMASTFTGQCSIEEQVDGQTSKKTMSTSKSDSSASRNTLASKSIASNPTPRILPTTNTNYGDEICDRYCDSDRYLDDRSSVYSDASSIASSASALHARQRMENQLETERKLLRQEESDRLSNDSMTKLKLAAQSNYGSDHSDLFSRNRSVSAAGRSSADEHIYQNVPNRTNNGERDCLTHGVGTNRQEKIRKVASCSSADVNRRSTLHGDIRLTDAELRQAREDVRRSVRGKDDSFLTRNDMDDFGIDEFATSRVLSPRFDLSFADDFFNSPDDFLGSPAFESPFHTANSIGRGSDFLDRYFTANRYMNPYSTRKDLSREDSCEGSVASCDSFYAKSDSGIRPASAGNKKHHFASDVNRNRENSRSSLHGSVSSPFTDSVGREKIDTLPNTRRYHSEYDTKSLDSHMLASGLGSTSFSDKLYSADDNRASDSRLYRNVNTATGDTGKRSGQSINADTITSITNGRHSTAAAGKTVSNKHIIDSQPDAGQSNDLKCDDSFTKSNGERSTDKLMDWVASSSETPVVEASTRTGTVRGGSEHGDTQTDDDRDGTKWDSRRQRIDKALSWIRSELGILRGQDKVLLSQFQRCQESIDQLKRQRPWDEVYSDEELEEEDGRHWEDWEIEDFDRSQAQKNKTGRQAGRKDSPGPAKDRTESLSSLKT